MVGKMIMREMWYFEVSGAQIISEQPSAREAGGKKSWKSDDGDCLMTRAKMKQLLFQRTVNSEEALFQNKINKRWSPALDKIYIYWAEHWAFNPHYLPISIQSRNSVFSCFIVCSSAFSCLCDRPLSPLITSSPNLHHHRRYRNQQTSSSIAFTK